MKRPLLAIALLFTGGILAAEIISPRIWATLIGIALAAALALRRVRWRLILLYLLLPTAGFTEGYLSSAILSAVDLRNTIGKEPRLAQVRGELTETPTLRVYQQKSELPTWRTLGKLRVTAVCTNRTTWQPASGHVAVTTATPLTNHFAGERVEIMGVLALPKQAVAEGLFDYRTYLRRQNIYYQLTSESENDWQVLARPPAPPLADRFSIWARQALAMGQPIEDESLRLEWALTLGWRTALTEEACDPLVRAATYHIFAVDGLRMAIIFGIFYSVLHVLGVPRAAVGIILLPVIWFYVALTGWPASAIRASVMLTIIIGGWALKRPIDPMNSLFAAALLILIFDPQQLFQAGFQLSFVVVLCLILTIPKLFDWVKRLTAPDPWLPRQLHKRLPPLFGIPARYTGDLAVTSFAAWVGSLPLVAYYFNIVTPVSTPANIVAVPLCVLVLVSNLISLLLAAWFPAAAILFNHAGWFGMECIRHTSSWFANWPAAYCYVPAPSLFTISLYYALLLAVLSGWLLKPTHRAWRVSAAGLAVLIWSVGYYDYVTETRLTIVSSGSGAIAYSDRFGASEDLVIDVGPTNSVQFVSKPFLRAQGVNKISGLLLTHGDVRHTGGTERLLEDFKIKTIYTSSARFRSSVYRRILERLQKVPGLVKPVSCNDQIAGWTVLHPDHADRFTKADDACLVLATDFQGTRVLLLSELGRAGQAALVARHKNLHADILVTGMPTSGEPVQDELLDAVRPQFLIITDSDLPVSERPSWKLRRRLSGRPFQTIYTSETGSITLTFRSGHWRWRGMKPKKTSEASPTAAGEPEQKLPPQTTNEPDKQLDDVEN
jgi:competence protein ComEC